MTTPEDLPETSPAVSEATARIAAFNRFILGKEITVIDVTENIIVPTEEPGTESPNPPLPMAS